MADATGSEGAPLQDVPITVPVVQHDAGGGSSVGVTEAKADAEEEQDTRVDVKLSEGNPFANRTFHTSIWFKTQCVVMAPIACVRLILLTLLFLFTVLYLRGVVCCACRRKKATPPSTGLLWVLAPVNWSCRAALFVLGVYWLEESFPPGFNSCGCGFFTADDSARLVVPTHNSVLDALYFGSRFLPVAVMKAPLAKPILVPRSPEERARLPNVVDAIRDKATATKPRYPPVLIFPEGTTVNQDSVIQFQKGAFIPGVPVSPCLISYPYRRLDVSWTPDIGVLRIVWRILCSLYVRMRVEYLPLYEPSEDEITDPALYSRNVQAALAEAGNRVPCAASNYDAFFVGAALRRSKSLAEYSLTHLIHAMDTRQGMKGSRRPYSELLHLAKLFKSADTSGDGQLTFDEFKAMFDDDEETSDRSKEIVFQLLDKNGDNVLHWKEIVLGVGARTEDLPAESLFELAFEVYAASGKQHADAVAVAGTGAGAGAGGADAGADPSASPPQPVITAEQLRRVLAKAAEHPGNTVPTDETTAETIDAIVAYFDKDGDGAINRAEFFELAKAKPVFVSGAIRNLLGNFRVGLPADSQPLRVSPVRADQPSEAQAGGDEPAEQLPAVPAVDEQPVAPADGQAPPDAHTAGGD